MKIRKNVGSFIGMVICLAVVVFSLYARHNAIFSILGLIAAASFVIFLTMFCKEIKANKQAKPKKKLRKDIGSFVGMVICLLVAIASEFVRRNVIMTILGYIAIALFVVFLIMFCKEIKANKQANPQQNVVTNKKIDWSWIVAITLAVLFTIITIICAIKFGFLALIPFACLVAVGIWMVALLIKKQIIKEKLWIALPIAILLLTIGLLGVYAIEVCAGWNKAVDTLFVDKLVVEGDADIEGDANIKGDANVEGNTNIKGDANVEGNTNVKGDANVEGNANIKGDANVEGDANIKGDANVEGDANIKGDANVEQSKPNVTPEDEPSKEEVKPAPEDKHTHSYTKKVVAPTCTTKGYTVYTCECGDSYNANEKAALGHDYKSKVIAPTTEAQGYTIHTCSRCNKSYKDNYTDKLTPVVTPKFTIEEQGKGWWTIKFEGINSADIQVNDETKCTIEWLSADTFKVVNTYNGTGYFTVTDNASGEVIYLF